MTWEDNLKRYDDLVSRCPNFERKGKSMPYTSANGHMFSLLNKDGQLGFRFSEPQKEHYLEKFETSIFKSHGAVMRGYILITDNMFGNMDALAELLNESYQFVMSLDPK